MILVAPQLFSHGLLTSTAEDGTLVSGGCRAPTVALRKAVRLASGQGWGPIFAHPR
jgi:hypothetical protein